MIPKAYQGKYITSKDDGSYNYSDYFEATSSNYIIHSIERYGWTKSIVLNDANADYSPSINGKSILYYTDSPYTFRFYTNKQSKRELFLGQRASSGWGRYYIHVDDINK